jgi:phosphoribosyl 1,2-cyclic phosphodiesterase
MPSQVPAQEEQANPGSPLSSSPMRVRFWGVRGSTPTPQAQNLKFGGNTACVEIRTPGGCSLIFDAGTGIRALGQLLVDEAAGAPIQAHIFLTHFHWDHIQGLPFFAPLYGTKNSVIFHSGRTGRGLQETLEGQMAQPYFPVDFAQVAAQRRFLEMEADAVLEVGGASVHPFALNHPQGASGYRIRCGKSVVVYATDFEHGKAEFDDILLAQARNADLLICDAQYTPQEYEFHHGWGHSTWLHATALAREAGVKQLVLFHHDPCHDDHAMARIQTEARLEFKETAAAWEGLTAAL